MARELTASEILTLSVWALEKYSVAACVELCNRIPDMGLVMHSKKQADPDAVSLTCNDKITFLKAAEWAFHDPPRGMVPDELAQVVRFWGAERQREE